MSSNHKLKTFSLMVILMIGQVVATIETELSELDELRQNVSALWAEVALLREEVSNHHHGGHLETDHDRIVMDVGVMQHEQHIHHDHTEEEAKRIHPYHQLHHSHDALAHINLDHNHDSGPQSSQDEHDEHFFHKVSGHDHAEHSGDHSGHDHAVHSGDHSGHSHDHSDRFHNHGGHDHEGSGHVHVIKVNFVDHDHSHEDDDEHGHDHHSHGGHSHDDDSHSHDHDHDHEHDHDHDHGHGHDHDHDGSHDHGHSHDHSPDVKKNNHDDHHISNLDVAHPLHPRNQEDVAKATCDLRPNTADPASDVQGSVIITQKKDGEGPVYFDVTISGFQVNGVSESRFGFHIHGQPVDGSGDCGSTGGHFNPHGVVHGGPTDETRHTGDLGNIVVPADGHIDGYIIVDHKVAFTGDDNIIGKSIVVHAGEDDLGTGGDAGSLTTGNAGGRVACCNIYLAPAPRFRFGG